MDHSSRPADSSIVDAELAPRALAGDRAAFDALAARIAPRLTRFVQSLLWDVDEADGVVQETWSRAWEGLGAYRPDESFAGWVHGIALNICRRVLRDRARHAEVVSPEQLQQVAALEGRRQGVLSGILSREAERLAMSTVAELPLPLREAFVLHFIEGLDYGEIAKLSGVAEGTLRVRAHRARALLRDRLGPSVDTWMREAR